MGDGVEERRTALLTQDAIDAIEARAGRASPPPWVKSCHGQEQASGSRWWSVDIGYHTQQTLMTSRRQVCRIMASTEQGDHDASFIAHARDDVPALVVEVRRLRSLVAYARNEVAKSLDTDENKSLCRLVASLTEILDAGERDG